METDKKEKIIFNCPDCGLTLSVSIAHAGITSRCPSCGNRIKIPAKNKSK